MTRDAESFVAFFRNLNVGQRNNPTTSQLVSAFYSAGAVEAFSVQGNGTVVFSALQATRVCDDALLTVQSVCAYSGIAMVRPLSRVLQLAEQFDTSEVVSRLELSVFDHVESFPVGLPLAGRRCRIVMAGRDYAITENEREGESNATLVLERILQVPVTSRGAPTILRLAARAIR